VLDVEEKKTNKARGTRHIITLVFFFLESSSGTSAEFNPKAPVYPRPRHAEGQ
jgi:hypothetical protein